MNHILILLVLVAQFTIAQKGSLEDSYNDEGMMLSVNRPEFAATGSRLALTIEPEFTQVAPICAGSALQPLPTTSLNGVTGTWSPNLSNLATTTYTFTPSNPDEANAVQMTIIVTPTATPLFDAMAPICQGAMVSVPLNTLANKSAYFFGDSVTAGANAGVQYRTLVANALGMNIVGAGSYAVQGTTMMQQVPIDRISAHNMEYWATAPNTPLFNASSSGLLFVAYLTNDVGLNLPNYTLENFGLAIDNVIAGIHVAGWPNSRIKFNVRYYCTLAGLNYGFLGVTNPADFNRYNAFAQLLRDKLDGEGIQYFDFWDELAAVPSADSHLDAAGRHPDNFMHGIMAQRIINTVNIDQIANLPLTSNNGISGSWSPAFNNNITTTYTFTPNDGQCASPTTMTVVVQQPISSSTDVIACNSYTWQANSALYTNSGTYNYTGPDANGCAGTATLNLTVYNAVAPTAQSPQTFTSGATVSDIVIDPSNNTWYASYADADAQVNPLNANTTLIDGTVYYATNTSDQGCTSNPVAVAASVILSNDTFNQAPLKLYPNPTSRLISFKYNTVIKSIKVFDTSGRLLMDKSVASDCGDVDFSNFNRGTYFLKFCTDGLEWTAKIIKQ